MNTVSRYLLVVVGFLLYAPGVHADEVKAITSGAFTAAFIELGPQFEKATGHTLTTAFGASMGGAADSIPARLARGEAADVVIMSAATLDQLIKDGKVVPGSRVDLVRSRVGMVVRKGAPKPDISTVDALTRTLRQATSIGYSASNSGNYLSTELFPRLGVWDEIKGKSKRVLTERVAAVVARGEVEIGFQQISELADPGVDFVGALPGDTQRSTIFSIGVVTHAKSPAAAKALIAFLTSPAAAPAIIKSGLDILTSR